MCLNIEAMRQTASDVLKNNEILLNARRQAGILVNGDASKMNYCCAATLSYILINAAKLDLRPTPRAMKLAYILETELHFTRVPIDAPRMPGDIGVVDQPHMPCLMAMPGEGFIADGDAEDLGLFELSKPEPKYTGRGYVEPDPDNKNDHHIYLVLSPVAGSPFLVQVADNQAPAPHPRDIRGNGNICISKTNYFLRAPI